MFTNDALTAVIDKSAHSLKADQGRIVDAEAAVAQAREALKRAQDDAQRNANDIADQLQEAIDAAKSAQLAEETEASKQIEEQNDLLARKLAALKAAYDAATNSAQVHHDQEVRQIADKMSADRDQLLGELLGASKVLEDAFRVATGW